MVMAPIRAITFGTFDLFHIGHLNLLARAAELGVLTVGVSTDDLSIRKKNRAPMFSHADRLKIVSSLSVVGETFFEDSLEKKREYIMKYKADVLVMGDDWAGKFDHLKELCDVTYLPRTPGISTTHLVGRIAVEGFTG